MRGRGQRRGNAAAWRARALGGLLGTALLAAGCGGGGSEGSSSSGSGSQSGDGRDSASATPLLSTRDAAQLAVQATFGPSETLITTLRNRGAAGWVQDQIALRTSSYALGGSDLIHKNTNPTYFCDLPGRASPTCWRDWYSTHPLVWSFYRNAVHQPDQLRQRMAFALQQILVVSGVAEIGTYGLREYHNMLLANAFGNYRTVLTKVAKSPVMGIYLNHVNNHKDGPNENFARELMQLFSIGPCKLNGDGTLTGGACQPTYTNDTVRAYAAALTGWTYPAGGATAWGCWPKGTNCTYLKGDMVPVAAFHDTGARTLLSGVTVPAGSTAPQALDAVVDSLMKHPNLAPFLAKRLIQQFVTSNPSAAYVSSVAQAFRSGRYTASEGGASYSYGTGQSGDLAATIAAVLLNPAARPATPAASFGKLRDPVLMTTAVLRALNGKTDGDYFMYQTSLPTGERPFFAPSVFGFYSPSQALPGSSLLGPEFGIDNAGTAIARLNYLTAMIFWDPVKPESSVPGAVGTAVNLKPFESSAANAGTLVDRLATVATGAPLPAAPRAIVVKAVESINSQTSSNIAYDRVRQAAYLVFATPEFQVQP